MKLRAGNFWKSQDLVLLVCCNCAVIDDTLLMVKGAPKELLNRFPGINKHFGKAIEATCGSFGDYGVMIDTRGTGFKRYGIFQTRYTEDEMDDLNVLKYSTGLLIDYLKVEKCTVSLTMPNGGLPMDLVIPVLAKLPDSVTVWIDEQ